VVHVVDENHDVAAPEIVVELRHLELGVRGYVAVDDGKQVLEGLLQYLDVSADELVRVVDLVADAADQLPQGGELVRLLELLLVRLLERNVAVELHDAVDLALDALKAYRGDITFRSDYLEPDPFRIPAIDHYMKEPFKLIDYAVAKLEIDDLDDYYVVNLLSVTKAVNSEQFSLKLGDIAPYDDPALKKLNAGQIEYLRHLFALHELFNERLNSYYADYSKPFIDSLVEGFTLLLEEKAEDEFLSVDQLDSLGQYEDKWAAQLVHLADGFQAQRDLFDYFVQFFETDIAGETATIFNDTRPISYSTPYGQIIIGDSTDNSYSGDLFIVFDPGGNDTYDIAFDGIGRHSYIFDYSGNDTYITPKNRVSPYFFGASFVFDYSGDDLYNASSWSLGAGLFGVGIVYDMTGHDKYMGDTFTQGAGCFGVGILLDESGNDTYQAALYSQGFGFVEGIGLLQDNSGNDIYTAGGKYKDILRYEDHYLSLSQGFAYGIRPKMSGGVGLLVDQSGNDVYVSDIFAQGTGYWYGLGLLADGSGNDQYISFQYAQGCATHMALGILYDVSGDDNYAGKGLMQGVGHDRAVGICLDLAGNDNYSAYDLSQGAASANGFGLLADIKGKDSYIVRSNQSTQGYGRPDRYYGSLGLFLDLEGQDGYSGGMGRDSTWWTYSKWGVGIDR